MTTAIPKRGDTGSPARRPIGLAALAAGCAATIVVAEAAAGWPFAAVRFAAGLVLCCYLPGRLAVGLLFPRRRLVGRSLDVMLTGALSLVATMLVGLGIAASGLRIDAASVAAGQLVVCAALAGWLARTRASGDAAADGFDPDPDLDFDPDSGDGDGDGDPARPEPGVWTSRGVRWWLAALPALLLTGLLVVQVVGLARQRQPDSYFTELAAGPEQNGISVVVVRSRERAAVDFRVEETVDGRSAYTAEFTLRPGESTEFAVARRATGRVELRLYRVGDTVPYRRLTLQPG